MGIHFFGAIGAGGHRPTRRKQAVPVLKAVFSAHGQAPEMY
ncbi:MAG: hypothetical protein ABW188_15525 [Rhodococcus fascians]